MQESQVSSEGYVTVLCTEPAKSAAVDQANRHDIQSFDRNGRKEDESTISFDRNGRKEDESTIESPATSPYDDDEDIDYEGSALEGDTKNASAVMGIEGGPSARNSSSSLPSIPIRRAHEAVSEEVKIPIPDLLPVQLKVDVPVGKRAVLECMSNIGPPHVNFSWSRTCEYFTGFCQKSFEIIFLAWQLL